MGDIIDMQKALAKRNETNLSYVRNKTKPTMDKKGIKGFLTLVAPGASNKYKLDQNQRKVQLYGITIIGIATALSALAIGSTIISGNSIDNPTAETREMLQQDDLMKIAENKLLECVFGDELDNIDSPNVVYEVDAAGYKDLKVIYGEDEKAAFTYSPGLLEGKFTNAKEIVSLMNDAIDVHDYASKKNLEDLKESIEKTKDKNFKLKNGHIVEDKQIENDQER